MKHLFALSVINSSTFITNLEGRLVRWTVFVPIAGAIECVLSADPVGAGVLLPQSQVLSGAQPVQGYIAHGDLDNTTGTQTLVHEFNLDLPVLKTSVVKVATGADVVSLLQFEVNS